ncbi:non-ribosomal peptide synthetase [Streptomyces sp. NBC_00306]|uniref:non-ribosomal peptide synthetase n=1 Tax=Streptomyces sp. NBC_00306 TaxID=2975708 RepID=UPI002E2ADC57|nr:non-ribosomal peptide synthetase [Streptomyces sp. NBC_00306]
MHTSITGQYLARFRRIADADNGAGLLPVTGAQRRFVLVRAMDPAGRPDTVPMFFAFPRGTVDPARLRAAANHLAARHPVLHARPEVIRGTPALRREAADVPLERVRPAPGESSADALRRAVSAWSAQGSPMRLYLTDDERADEEILGIVLDHIACDGQSLARVVDELGDAYRDGLGPGDLAPADAEAELAAYREAVELQLDAEQRGGSPAALEYWGDRLRAVHERAPLPRPRDPAPGVLPTGAAELRRSAPAGGVPFPTLLDACRATARVLYGPGHVPPIGYPWGGRPAAAAQVLGCFLNTVVFPARTHDAPQLPEDGGSEATATAWWDDLDRADTPFDEVVHAARSAGARWTGRLDGLLTVDDARRRPPLTFGGVPGREVHIDGRPVRAPFAVSLTQGPELHIRMVWDRSVLDDAAAEDGFAAFCRALPAPASADPAH